MFVLRFHVLCPLCLESKTVFSLVSLKCFVTILVSVKVSDRYIALFCKSFVVIEDTFPSIPRFFPVFEAQPEVRYVHTTLYSVKVTRYLQGCVSRASNVGYFFLWKLSLKSVMFTLLCIALRLPDTFRCVTRASNVGYLFLWKPSLKSVMLTPLCIVLRLPDTFRGVSRAAYPSYPGCHTFP